MSEPYLNRKKYESRDRSLFWGTSWITLYTAINLVTKIARGTIIPRFLIPVTYGLWSSLSILFGYMRYADLGILQQLTKRLPYQLGKEGIGGYWDLAGRGISWMICVTVAASTGLLGYSFLYQGSNPWFYQTAFRLLALVIVFINARLVLTTLLVARQEFRVVSVNSSMTDVLGLVMAVVGLLTLGVMGLIWALLFAELVGALHCLYHIWRIGMPRLRWQLRGVTVLIREGLVLLGVGFSEQIMMTVDQLFVLRFFTKDQFGIYALGLFITTAVIALSGIFLTAQPRILELWGNGQQEQSQQILETSVALCILASALCVGPFILMIDLILRFYLKEYAIGLAVFVLMPAIALARGPVILLRSHFLAHNRERRLIAFQVCGLLFAALLNGLIIWQQWGIAYVVLASTSGYLLISVLMFIDFERGRLKIDRAKYAMLVASLSGVIGLFLFYQNREGQPNTVWYIIESLAASAAYTLVITGVLFATWRSWSEKVRLYTGITRIPLLSGLRKGIVGTMGGS